MLTSDCLQPSAAPNVPFAAVVPIGGTAVDLWRGVELVRSLLFWESSNLVACVLIDDSPRSRGLAELSMYPDTCQVLVLPSPLTAGRGGWSTGRGSWLGTVSASILKAMAWVREHTDARFVLRVDADALVIGPFAAAISSRITETTTAGLFGSRGISCNPVIRALQDLTLESRLSRALRLWPRVDSLEPQAEQVEVDTFGRISRQLLASFEQVRPHIARAASYGYGQNDYCQGGACVVTRVMLDRMAHAGYLAHPEAWNGLPFPDDIVLAMYARAVGLCLCDCSRPGEPFGVQHQGLPYPPEELIRRGYALIHSVRNDKRLSEGAIRDFFRRREARHAPPRATLRSACRRIDAQTSESSFGD